MKINILGFQISLYSKVVPSLSKGYLPPPPPLVVGGWWWGGGLRGRGGNEQNQTQQFIMIGAGSPTFISHGLTRYLLREEEALLWPKYSKDSKGIELGQKLHSFRYPRGGGGEVGGGSRNWDYSSYLMYCYCITVLYYTVYIQLKPMMQFCAIVLKFPVFITLLMVVRNT